MLLKLLQAFGLAQTQALFTPGIEAKGRGKSCDPIGWELNANPKSFRLGVKANN